MTQLRTVFLALTVAFTSVVAGGAGADAAVPAACASGVRPNAPTLQATAAGDGVRVTWDRVPDADGYQARYSWFGVGADGKPYTGPADSPWQPVSDPASGLTVTAPADAGQVTVEVAATNGCGASDPALWQGPRSSPAAPTRVTAFPGRTTIIVSWTPGHPRSAPNYADARYVAMVQPSGRSCTVERDAPNNCTITGLTLGERYSVSVQGTNELGAGAVGSAPRPVTLAIGPTPPRAIRVVTTRTTARVSWQPPRSTGGGAIRGYRVTSEPGGRSCRTTGLTCSVTGLTPGTTYRFLVVARNGKVEGFPGRSATVSTLAPPPTPQPTAPPTDPAKPPQDLRTAASTGP
jgi:hypothetical protein